LGQDTFAAAALMLQNGLRDEGYKTAWGVYNVVYDKKGYWFRPPNAWDRSGDVSCTDLHAPGRNMGHGGA